MDNRTPEREWLLKVAGNVAKGNTHKEVQEKGTKEKNSPQPSPSKKGKGLEDVAGLTDDEETTVYGFIDTEMNVLVKFQYIGCDWERLKEMRCEAERKLRK